jgi:hypothetical protein
VSRRWAVIVAVVLLAAGVAAAIGLSRPSHTDKSRDIERLLPPPHVVTVLPPQKVPFHLLGCRQVTHYAFMRADSATVSHGTTSVSGRPVHVLCHAGSPTFRTLSQLVTFALAPDAVVRRRLPHGTRRLAASELPSYLADPDRFSGSDETYVYRFFGPQTSIDKMVEVAQG